ncbi:MAG: glucose-1-phosphate thymidylyltransferase [Actinobacteria bacterium]|nr:MAG: glucose-1-phosphate thymidylyltransferase [Actinomycetota bacterium]
MKGLVLAGGSGTRLRPLTYSLPKQLIPVANTPVIEHCLANLRDAGIEDIGIVVNEKGSQFVEQLGDGTRLGVRLTYLPQDKPRGLAHCVMIARSFLGDDDFAMYLGDNVFAGGITDLAERFRRRRPAVQLAVAKVDNPSAYGVAEVDGDYRVRRVVEKPTHPVSDLAITGLYFFTPAIHRAVAAISPSRRGELEITDAIQQMLEWGERVDARPIRGHWRDTGSPPELLECNRLMLDAIPDRRAGSVDAASQIVGPVFIEPGARIVRSRCVGPAVIGAGALVVDSEVRPYTSIAPHVVLRRSVVEYSIVMRSARIEGPTEIYGSVIGPHARVFQVDPPDRGHRLLIGSHCSVLVGNPT